MTTGDSESPPPPTHSRSDSGSDVPSPSSKSVVSVSVPRNGVQESSASRSRKADDTKIIQVANIAPQATREQMQTLFGYIGKIDDLRLYPTMDLGMRVSSKICFVKFNEISSVGTAQHMTNTVFIDRALIVIPYIEGDIPDEQKSLDLLGSGTLLPGIADPKLPQHVTSQLEGIPPNQVVITTDPKLIEQNVPAYPPLPPTYDTRKIEEIRRTIVIANVDSELGPQDVVDYFSQAGEVKYFRFCTRDNDPLHYALIEFSDQPSIIDALHLNGTTLGTKVMKVYHSTQAIIKPQAKTNQAAQREIEDAMSSQAHTLLSQGLDGSGKDNWRGRGPARPRSRSRGRSRRTRSRSKSHRRSRSGSRHSRHRSSSRVRDRSHRSDKKKARSRSRGKKRSGSERSSRSHGRVTSSASRSEAKKSRSTSRKRDEKKKSKREDKKKSKRDKDPDRKKEKDKKRDSDKKREVSKENGVKHSDSKSELVEIND